MRYIVERGKIESNNYQEKTILILKQWKFPH